MRLTLARALVVSLLLHVALSQALLAAGLLPGRAEGGQGPPLRFELVEPAADPDRPPRPDEPTPEARGNVPARAALGGAPGPRAGGGPATRVPDRNPDPADDPASRASAAEHGERSGEAGDLDPRGTGAAHDAAPSVPTPEPTDVAELERRLELEEAALPEVSMGRLHPLLVRWARHPEGHRASSYRELLRTYIDVLMGHPYPVVDWLRRHPIRYLAELEVAVDAAGDFRFTEIYFYPSLPDTDRRVRDYYRRLLREVEGHPFLPPAEAGLPAPHRLSYRLVNPETR